MKEQVFYIYGAGIIASTVYTAIKELYHCRPRAFYVSGMAANPIEIEGIPVWEKSRIDIEDHTCKYLIATAEVHHRAISDELSALGIKPEQVIFVDNQLENRLLDEYYRSLSDFVTVNEIWGNDTAKDYKNGGREPDITVFQAKCHVDKPLKNVGEIPGYIQPIQVGAALTETQISRVRDDAEPDNISAKNRNYCELTASYYAWKNCNSAYKGLCHYRRIFDVSQTQLHRLIDHGVDVILPYPSVHYPDIRSQHEFCIHDGDWRAMLQALSEVAPDYYEAYDEIFSGHYFYNFNMLIARREVFDDYCRFIFSVLERAEQLTIPKGWERTDRFAGYMGENLTTLYFRKNRNRLKVVHAGKWWFV